MAIRELTRWNNQTDGIRAGKKSLVMGAMMADRVHHVVSRTQAQLAECLSGADIGETLRYQGT